MNSLIGYTGFVGSHLKDKVKFDLEFNSKNIDEIRGLDTELLVCAGLPAAKWHANNNPEQDYLNMIKLAQDLTMVRAKKAVLISSIDVFQPAFEVSEEDSPSYDGKEAYGRNRAWFELFFTNQFPDSTIMRLPGLFAQNLRKNLIFDLMNKREDQFKNVSRDSLFQFFDVSKTWDYINICLEENIRILNIATEPILAQEIADIFEVSLSKTENQVRYNMLTINCTKFNRFDGYLEGKNEILNQISKLKAQV